MVLAVLSLQWSTCFLRVIRPAVVSDDGPVAWDLRSWGLRRYVLAVHIVTCAPHIITVRNKTCTCTRGQSRTDTTHEETRTRRQPTPHASRFRANRLDRRGRRRERSARSLRSCRLVGPGDQWRSMRDGRSTGYLRLCCHLAICRKATSRYWTMLLSHLDSAAIVAATA